MDIDTEDLHVQVEKEVAKSIKWARSSGTPKTLGQAQTDLSW